MALSNSEQKIWDIATQRMPVITGPNTDEMNQLPGGAPEPYPMRLNRVRAWAEAILNRKKPRVTEPIAQVTRAAPIAPITLTRDSTPLPAWMIPLQRTIPLGESEITNPDPSGIMGENSPCSEPVKESDSFNREKEKVSSLLVDRIEEYQRSEGLLPMFVHLNTLHLLFVEGIEAGDSQKLYRYFQKGKETLIMLVGMEHLHLYQVECHSGGECTRPA